MLAPLYIPQTHISVAFPGKTRLLKKIRSVQAYEIPNSEKPCAQL